MVKTYESSAWLLFLANQSLGLVAQLLQIDFCSSKIVTAILGLFLLPDGLI